jgi:hypothetical protein
MIGFAVRGGTSSGAESADADEYPVGQRVERGER